MGAWGSDPFDNDSAADFAADLGHMPKENRMGWIHKALLKVQEGGGGPFEPEYEFPYEYEHAIAGAAFLADAHKGQHVFTDTVYAKVLDPGKDFKDDDAWSHVELDKPDQWLVDMAVRVMEDVAVRMKAAKVEPEWVEPVERIVATLKG